MTRVIARLGGLGRPMQQEWIANQCRSVGISPHLTKIMGSRRYQHERTSTHRLACLIGVCLIWFHPIAWGAEPKPGGTLRVAWEADATGFDPGFSRGIQAYYLKGNIFNPLVTVDADLNFVPELAESWEAQENGKVYVFHLRQGVKFHDGTDFNAEAVRWNILWTTDRESQSVMDAFLDTIETVEVIDAHTVKIILKYPTFTLLPALAQYREGLLIKSPTAYEKVGKQDAQQHPVGTGPFKLAKWEQNNLIVLEKNKEYWKPGLPYLDRIEFKIMKDGVTRATALRAGEVDYVSWLPREHVDRVAKESKIQVWTGKGSSTAFSAFNVSRKPFDDQRVRIALAGYGIDRRAIAKAALLGHGGPQWGFLPPGAKGFKDFSEMYPYDPEKAKALLKEAGFDEQNPLKYSLDYPRGGVVPAHHGHHHEDAAGEGWRAAQYRGPRPPDFPETHQRPRLRAAPQCLLSHA